MSDDGLKDEDTLGIGDDQVVVIGVLVGVGVAFFSQVRGGASPTPRRRPLTSRPRSE